MQKLRANRSFGSNLRALRMESHFTQARLAAKLNLMGIDLERSTYSRFETGELNVPINVLVGLHLLYGCSYDAFFEGLSVEESRLPDPNPGIMLAEQNRE